MVSIPKLRKSVVVVENHIHYIPKNELNYHQKLSKGATSTVYLGKVFILILICFSKKCN